MWHRGFQNRLENADKNAVSTPGAGRPGRWRSNALAIVVVCVFAIALLGVGVVFSNSFGMQQVASNARSLHWTNATLGSAGISRAAVAQSVFFSFDERAGLTASDAKPVAIAEARHSLDPVKALLTAPDRSADAALTAQLASYVDLAEAVIDEAETGSPDAAEGQRLNELEPTYTELRAALRMEQTKLADLISATETSSGRLAQVTQLAITFLIPALTLVFFWWALRRRSRVRESDLQVRLDAARQLSDAKDEFIAGLSHELRTPLTTIHGFSELLLEKEFDTETREMLTIINGGSADLSRMVADLLAAARIDAEALSWQPEKVDIQRELQLAVAPYTRSDHQIDISVPSLRAYADPVHLRQIIHNLVSNAARHGGEQLNITGKLKGDFVALVFADNGGGVAPETEALLFKRFVHRGKKAMVAGSVGLGLAVCRELAIRMGGSISYQRVDGWTTFTLLVPRTGKQAPSMEPVESEAHLASA